MKIVSFCNFWCQGILSVKCKDWAFYSLRVGARSWSWKKFTAEIRSSLVVAQTQGGGSYFHPGGMEGVVFPIEVDDTIHGLTFISRGDHVPFSKTSWVVPFLGSFLISWFLNSLLTTILVLTTIFMGPRFHCLHLHLNTLWPYVFGSVDIVFRLHHGDQQVVVMLLRTQIHEVGPSLWGPQSCDFLLDYVSKWSPHYSLWCAQLGSLVWEGPVT